MYISLVDRVLDQHSGTKVEKLLLTTFDATGQENHVIGWMHQVVAKGVVELSLDFSGGKQPFPFSSDLIDVTPIRALKLNYCQVGSAKKLNGLRSLKTLVLGNVRLKNKFTNIIFINCLPLENLEIVNCINNNSRLQISAGHLKHFKSLKVERCKDIDSIFISAPTLESLGYSGGICKFIFDCLFRSLDVASFYIRANRTYKQLGGIKGIITAISICRNLTISSAILEGLSPRLRDFECKELNFYLWRLRKLTLFLGGSGYHKGITFVNPCDVAYFLKKCPLLLKIYIALGEFPFEEGLFWNLIAKESQCYPSFQFLKDLRIMNFKLRDLEFQLLKSIVENAPSI